MIATEVQFIATIVQTLILTVYVLFLVKRFGVLPSISDSTYNLQGNGRLLFTITLWGVAFANTFQPMGAYGIVASIMLLYTGATITFKDKETIIDEIHYISATVAIGSMFLGLWMLHGLWITTVFLLVGTAIAYWLDEENIIWWFEIIAFTILMITFFTF